MKCLWFLVLQAGCWCNEWEASPNWNWERWKLRMQRLVTVSDPDSSLEIPGVPWEALSFPHAALLSVGG